jgi:hypothetical protein
LPKETNAVVVLELIGYLVVIGPACVPPHRVPSHPPPRIDGLDIDIIWLTEHSHMSRSCKTMTSMSEEHVNIPFPPLFCVFRFVLTNEQNGDEDSTYGEDSASTESLPLVVDNILVINFRSYYNKQSG